MHTPVTTQELPAASDSAPQDVSAPHPEEMAAGFSFRIGDKIALQSRARATPAGIIATGLATSAILLSVGFMVHAIKRR